ncbi:hypothetical protein P0W64_20875 [Tsukamurella sp. 8F]|uniref:hypothetical protein n=1 Tax=unclassified Tsukamurella TaxID=2633480 RepID=UPI0023BA3291|nr:MULTISPECIES: hypothetical protein [unclassified Tsukamurella]MDF0532198.1 hypothetical protein [Tsukamurella sp. 8J]MDF0589239.1 hypothetical protein [Tsukamurella sp. 8F]
MTDHAPGSGHTDIARNKLLRTVAIALVLVFPFLKVLYTTGDSEIAGEVVRLHGPSGWAAVILDNVLSYPALFLTLFVLISGSASVLSTAATVSRRVLGRSDEAPAPSAAVTVLLVLTAPVLGSLWALVLFGPLWAIATGSATLIFRMPSDAQRVRYALAARRGSPAPRVHERLSAVGKALLHVLALVVLPLVVLYVIFDGRAWETARLCNVESVGEGTHPAVIIEIERGSNGISTGWRVGTKDIVSGTGCVEHDDHIRKALWD